MLNKRNSDAILFTGRSDFSFVEKEASFIYPNTIKRIFSTYKSTFRKSLKIVSKEITSSASPKENRSMISFNSILTNSPYPGRGIACGLNERGNRIVAYFITGRSTHSQNRLLIENREGVFTQAIDESLVNDPSLIIYRAMASVDESVVIANGNHSEALIEGLYKKKSMQDSLAHVTYEPDEPYYTPRISALYRVGETPSYTLSIIKRGEEGKREHNYYHYTPLRPTEGHLIHTYEGRSSTLQSFRGEPIALSIIGSSSSIAQEIWDSLEERYKVALIVKEFDKKRNCIATIIKKRGDR